jgi:hypothetical protein
MNLPECAVAQVVSRWFLTAQALIRAQGTQRGICGEQNGTGKWVSPRAMVSLCQYNFIAAPYSLTYYHLRVDSGLVSGSSSTETSSLSVIFLQERVPKRKERPKILSKMGGVIYTNSRNKRFRNTVQACVLMRKNFRNGVPVRSVTNIHLVSPHRNNKDIRYNSDVGD